MMYQLKQMPKKAALYTAVATTVMLSSVFQSQAGETAVKKPTIIVSATGETQAAPDMAILNISVMTKGDTAQNALSENNKAMNNVLDAFKSNGVEPKDLQTSGLSIYQKQPDEKYSKGDKDELYQVSNSLNVRIRNLDNAGKLFDQAVSLGINSVRGITFTNADPKPFYKEARKQAVAQAIDKATTLAEAAQVKLGPIIEINETEMPSGPMPRLASAARSMAYSDTNFSGGELDYNVNVTVTFAIAE